MNRLVCGDCGKILRHRRPDEPKNISRCFDCAYNLGELISDSELREKIGKKCRIISHWGVDIGVIVDVKPQSIAVQKFRSLCSIPIRTIQSIVEITPKKREI